MQKLSEITIQVVSVNLFKFYLRILIKLLVQILLIIY